VKTLTLKLPAAMDARLARLARRRGMSKSAVVREALTAILEDGRRLKGLTAHDLAKDLCGCLEGPGDLSSNKKHLEDFGR
jgi:hypothetical protein